MRYIIRACIEREQCINELLHIVPSAIVVWDTTKNAMDTFLSALEIAGNDSAIHIEDDAILHPQFIQKSRRFIQSHDGVCQFFSRRNKDITIGTRQEYGSCFLCGVCFYLPPRYSKMLLDFKKNWIRITEHPTGLDLMVADFLKSRSERYWVCVPNLADHRRCISMIDRKRSKFRQSKTYGMEEK